jgi:hypothetical protein
MQVKQLWTGSATGNAIGFWTATGSSSTEKMTIRESGNVGINQPNPSAKLDVNGNVNLSGLLTVNNRATVNGSTASQEAFVVTQKVAGTIAAFRNLKDVALPNGEQVTRFLIKDGGYVGIDTSNADTKLLVKGDVRLTDGANGVLTLRGNDRGTQIVTGKKQGGDRDLQFMDRHPTTNAETELMRLTSAGRLGIGNDNPDANLNIGKNTPGNIVKIGGVFPGGAGLTLWNGANVGISTSSLNTAQGGFMIYENQDCGTNNVNGCVRTLAIGARD